MERIIRSFEELGRDDVDVAGGKGANLGELTRAGLPVPPGFVLTTTAYREFVASSGIGDQVLGLAALPADAEPGAYEEPSARIRELFRSAAVPDAVAKEVLDARLLLGDAPVAVRSSATAEDLEGASFAGQQDTYLNVRGTDALLVAVRDCWASLWTARAMAYRARQGIDPSAVALAVVVQRMVDADAAGVMFTANPTNGRRNETVVSAAWGLGESVVSGSVTTDDVVVEMPSGRVRSRTTAEKAVMTVATEQGTEEHAVPAAQRARQVLDDDDAAALARLGARIQDHFGAPQDVEWARAGSEVWIVQARPITALPEPEADAPTDWSVPDPKIAYYMRASIVEQLPDPLSPLFADLVDSSVTRSLQALFREFLGADVVRDGDVSMPTINGYAYYRYTRAGLTRLMLRSPAVLKVLTTSGNKGAQARWRMYSHPRYQQVVERWNARQLDGLTVPELLAGVGELLDAGTEYYTAVQTIIPIAAGSEVTFTQFYERLVRRAGDPPAATFLLGFDSAPIRAEKSLYDLGTWVREHPGLAEYLRTTASPDVVALLDGGGTPPGVEAATWQDWRSRFQAHLDRYGHTVYNLDFRNAVPADDPAPLLDTLRFYLGRFDSSSAGAPSGGGPDPYERQRRTSARREEATAAVLARLDAPRRATFTRLLRWAQGIAPVREDALADIGLAWPQLRRMLRELGERLVAAGTIDRADDVFWLRRDEVLGEAAPLGEAVEERKALWRGQRRATPPQILPQGTSWDRWESLMPAASADQAGPVLRGTGASAGQVTAAARVLGGPEDFSRMRPGDVLVASITTPAWTSLFAMASGVVTDVGGPLSHSSIVAREYGIPAVLGTGVATRRIADGSQIRVDGDAGTVTLLDEAGDDAAPPAGDRPASRRRPALAAVAVAGAAALVLARRRRRRR
ncbi:PEP/pyruvate-binding domain-containing protein [Pseudonocardia sp. CA-142604]|uniref:PEP/pyruvate-binding domain-containing protein n=1 Tax=Pseudonocardia sp. CA-142604 TaxID=3240024 RepID=UPI003D95081A